jgi:hypothetical protein
MPCPHSQFKVQSSKFKVQGSLRRAFSISAFQCFSVFHFCFLLFAFCFPVLASQVRLQDLNLSFIQQGWGTAQAGKSVTGLPLQMADKLYTNGIGTHAPALALVQLDGKADRFRATFGVNDTGRTERGSVQLLVFGDGKPLFKSSVVRGGDWPEVVEVPLAGVQRLSLQVTDGGDGMSSDHANLADAVITYSGIKPELIDPDAPSNSAALYPPADQRIASPGNTTYTVDPAKGEDLSKVNRLRLAPGDQVLIAPGVHHETLAPLALGTKDKPVVIRFAPGRHEFRADRAARLAYFISNSADAPEKPRPIGLLLKDCRHVQILGGNGTELAFADRMTYFINDHSEDVAYSGLTFDMVRPTVSEFRVLEAGTNSVVIQMAEGSSFAITQGRLAWTGDVGSGWTMAQEAIPDSGKAWRRGQWNPFSAVTAEDLGGRKVRLTYPSGNGGLGKDRQFQFRNTTRDTTSAVNTRSKDVVLRDCTFHALPGMGIVSQFTENITFDRVQVVPRPGTFRTCPAWADAFHFSGCRGDILVDSCNFSGTQDDAINIHGTHLRLIEKTGPNQVLVRFMQPQTYGIAAFVPGDKVEFVNHSTLRGYAANAVAALERRTDKDWLLTLAEPVAAFGQDDVVDNLSWYPDVTIRNCTVTMDSCRGFLLTTRGKALVEGCTFTRTAMSAILVEDDAEGWFESGPIRELTIRGNTFLECGEPVVSLNPHNGNNDPALPVHENIRIEDNFFRGGGISARSVKGLVVSGNRFTSARLPLSTTACSDVTTTNNLLGVQQARR